MESWSFVSIPLACWFFNFRFVFNSSLPFSLILFLNFQAYRLFWNDWELVLIILHGKKYSFEFFLWAGDLKKIQENTTQVYSVVGPYLDLRLELSDSSCILFYMQSYRFKTRFNTLFGAFRVFMRTLADFKEFERRFKFKPRLKYGWFHLKLYQMFQDLSRR